MYEGSTSPTKEKEGKAFKTTVKGEDRKCIGCGKISHWWRDCYDNPRNKDPRNGEVNAAWCTRVIEDIKNDEYVEGWSAVTDEPCLFNCIDLGYSCLACNASFIKNKPDFASEGVCQNIAFCLPLASAVDGGVCDARGDHGVKYETRIGIGVD